KEILSQNALSRREIEVAELLYSKQSSTKEIAAQLNISENTGATHIKHIFEKCGVNSRIAFYKLMNEKIT
ncbi:MAG: helix-turn-helix transcriptional regulator, partial [Treponemataceae bacterium]|nr:helix-turn-helix transcriptional regulator [Treponemataceae bacterium]